MNEPVETMNTHNTENARDLAMKLQSISHRIAVLEQRFFERELATIKQRLVRLEAKCGTTVPEDTIRKERP